MAKFTICYFLGYPKSCIVIHDGNFKTGFQVDNLVNLVNGSFTIKITNISYDYSKIYFKIDNIKETQKTIKPERIIEHKNDTLDRLMRGLDLSNSQLKFYHELEAENINLKTEVELLKLQIIDLTNVLKTFFINDK